MSSCQLSQNERILYTRPTIWVNIIINHTNTRVTFTQVSNLSHKHTNPNVLSKTKVPCNSHTMLASQKCEMLIIDTRMMQMKKTEPIQHILLQLSLLTFGKIGGGGWVRGDPTQRVCDGNTSPTSRQMWAKVFYPSY